jgi:hypothetical protein
LWLSYTLFAKFCWISMVTLLPWLLDFHGYPVTMVAGFPRLPCYHGCWSSMVVLLSWLLVFHGYSVAMVACKLTAEWRRNRGFHVHDRAGFRGVYHFRVYQGLTEFHRVTKLPDTHMTDEFNPEYTRVTSVRFEVNKLGRVTRLIPCWQRYKICRY